MVHSFKYMLMVPKTVLDTKICLVIRTRHPTSGGGVPYDWWRGTLQLVGGTLQLEA